MNNPNPLSPLAMTGPVSSRMILCCLCDYQAFSKGNLSFHLNGVHFKDKEFMCRLCHFKTAYKGALTRHVNSVHLRTGKTKECPICRYTTLSLLNLNSHLSAAHHLEIATAFARPHNQTKHPPPKDDKKDGEKSPSPEARAASTGGQQGPPAAAPARPQAPAPQPPPAHTMVARFPCRLCDFCAPEEEILVSHFNLVHLPHILARSGRAPVLPGGLAHVSALQQLSRDVRSLQQHQRQQHQQHQPIPTSLGFPPAPAAHMLQVTSGRVPAPEASPPHSAPSSPPGQQVHGPSGSPPATALALQQLHAHQLALREREERARRYSMEEHQEQRERVIRAYQERRLPVSQSPPDRPHPCSRSPSPNGESTSPPVSAPQAHSASQPSPPAHMNLHPLTCRLCLFVARSPTYLRNHIRTVHLEEVHTLGCPCCEYTSDTKEDIDVHVELEHLKRNESPAATALDGRVTSSDFHPQRPKGVITLE